MNDKLVKGLMAAATALTGIAALAGTANAYELKRAATQPTEFHTIINEFKQFVTTENAAMDKPGARALDVTKLRISKTQENVEAYFIHEGATFQNQLGFTATGKTNASGMLFSDISCVDRDCYEDNNHDGTPDGDLHIGDYVQMGKIEAGTQLDFWINANGVTQGEKFRYGVDASKNKDGLQHVVAYDYKGYLVVAFEDLYGDKGATGADPNNPGYGFQNSDRDFNDVVFAFNIGDSIRDIPSADVPEPSATAALIGAGALGLVGLRRRRSQASS